jgi:8-oxo-dGTP pyrophosphatase MutT (NUDIX family)
MKKKTLPGAFSFPSGTIEKGETPFDTTIREGNEELEIDLEPEKIIAKKELPEL